MGQGNSLRPRRFGQLLTAKVLTFPSMAAVQVSSEVPYDRIVLVTVDFRRLKEIAMWALVLCKPKGVCIKALVLPVRSVNW